MNTLEHMVLGAAVAAAPDAALALFGWRRTWLPPHHPLVRLHRWLHGPASVLLVVALAWLSHIAADRLSAHRSGPHA